MPDNREPTTAGVTYKLLICSTFQHSRIDWCTLSGFNHRDNHMEHNKFAFKVCEPIFPDSPLLVCHNTLDGITSTITTKSTTPWLHCLHLKLLCSMLLWIDVLESLHKQCACYNELGESAARWLYPTGRVKFGIIKQWPMWGASWQNIHSSTGTSVPLHVKIWDSFVQGVLY